jgi:hypothetical protein
MFLRHRPLLIQGLVVLTCLTAISGAPASAQKGGPNKPATQSWPCQLTLRDAMDEFGNPVDAIMSDGQGSYVNGQDGNRVSCTIAHAPGTGHDGWLEMFIDSGSVRSMTFPGRDPQTAYTRGGYNTFANQGSFEVKVIKTADVIGQTYLRAFRAYVNNVQFAGQARFSGNSFALAPIDRFAEDLRGTSSVFVTVIDACTWQVTSDPERALTPGETAVYPRVLELVETKKSGSPIRAADFSMPFSATVRVIGVKPGCGT